MAKYAQLITLNADLASDFGLEWATKLFGEEAIASLPIRNAGKNKGKPKGFVIWRKACVQGYCRDVSAPLAVGQMADAWIGLGACTGRNTAMSGKWLGRTQLLAASFGAKVFFEEGRERHRVERELEGARWEELKAEMHAKLLPPSE